MQTQGALLRYVAKGVVEMGPQYQITLAEDVIETEQITPSERMIDSLRKNEQIPDEVKKMIISMIESMEASQATALPPRAFANRIPLDVPKRLYEKLNKPQVGDVITLELRRELES